LLTLILYFAEKALFFFKKDVQRCSHLPYERELPHSFIRKRTADQSLLEKKPWEIYRKREGGSSIKLWREENLAEKEAVKLEDCKVAYTLGKEARSNSTLRDR